MEPRIQYAKTSDGVSIAYWTMGDGPPLLLAEGLFSHCQREWEFPERRAFIERLAHSYTVIKHDQRGSGLSDRHVADLSVEACAKDIEAVVDRIGLDQVAIFGATGWITALEYAARHPEKVSHVVAWQPGRFVDSPAFELLASLAEIDWELYTNALVLFVQGWAAGELSPRLAGLFRESTSPEAMAATRAANRRYDMGSSLKDYTTPTLLVYRPAARLFSEDAVRVMGAMIPRAETTFLDGDTFTWYLPDPEPVARLIEGFTLEKALVSPSQTSTGVFRTIMFTDIEESTSLTQRLGDASAQEMLRRHNAIIRKAVSGRNGSEIKHTGDGIMASFPSASGAVNAAIEIQKAFAEQDDARDDAPVKVRIGINAGEPVADKHPGGQGDLFGTAVIMASRIAALADGGEIFVSDVVRQLVAGKRYMFSDRGEQALRGFDDPVRVFEVRWREDE
jgi:class 3 adenylate cyclase/pimeloyl-ACP methyl ester carboxylesterase